MEKLKLEATLEAFSSPVHCPGKSLLAHVKAEHMCSQDPRMIWLGKDLKAHLVQTTLPWEEKCFSEHPI